ncbi:hypothetical protein EYF80_023923 [Liparis tanakae]|uniref:Uncharacterized protein n=1 Tax=Liparis tanakae TaxID=230148 RepID=A0A4Z2HLQ0_9TELE|nr:hypothetical protein EYF80_023923 [Liparis tanakae]
MTGEIGRRGRVDALGGGGFAEGFMSTDQLLHLVDTRAELVAADQRLLSGQPRLRHHGLLGKLLLGSEQPAEFCPSRYTPWCSGCEPPLRSADSGDDRLHPHDLISDHAEEPQLVRLGGDLHSTLLAGRQQLFPQLHDLVLAARDGFSLLAGIDRPELGRALLQLTHLAEWGERILGRR